MEKLEVAILGAIGVAVILLAWPRRWRGPVRGGVIGPRIRRTVRRKSRSRSWLVQATWAVAIFTLAAGLLAISVWTFRESSGTGGLALVLIVLLGLVLASW